MTFELRCFLMTNAESVTAVLNQLTQGSIGRLYTLKALIELGKGWHNCSQVATHIRKKYRMVQITFMRWRFYIPHSSS